MLSTLLWFQSHRCFLKTTPQASQMPFERVSSKPPGRRAEGSRRAPLRPTPTLSQSPERRHRLPNVV